MPWWTAASIEPYAHSTHASRPTHHPLHPLTTFTTFTPCCQDFFYTRRLTVWAPIKLTRHDLLNAIYLEKARCGHTHSG